MADIKGDESSSAEFDAHFGSGSLKDYQIEKAIGRGHFSVVHRAVRLCDGHRVALKKVQIFDMMDQKARGRCLKEVKLLQTLPPHSAIIQYIDAFIDSNELYIVFEWAEHGDLRRLLRRAQESSTSLQEVQIWRYFIQIADGIRHMHEARSLARLSWTLYERGFARACAGARDAPRHQASEHLPRRQRMRQARRLGAGPRLLLADV
jgi:serine/threonine protein kinase